MLAGRASVTSVRLLEAGLPPCTELCSLTALSAAGTAMLAAGGGSGRAHVVFLVLWSM